METRPKFQLCEASPMIAESLKVKRTIVSSTRPTPTTPRTTRSYENEASPSSWNSDGKSLSEQVPLCTLDCPPRSQLAVTSSLRVPPSK
mmetsp:Transcript_85397/g.178428  ORF Transcript_85397/g.178428 Transcript_85397/m.178428 type:complete len:89 (-) Transcript_85397:107-373(-)